MRRQLLLLSALFFPLFMILSGCESQKNEGATETIQKLEQRDVSYRSLLRRNVKQLFESFQRDTEVSAEGTARKLKQNRAFMLAYFLDQSRNAPVVKGAATYYRVFTGVDYVILTDTAGSCFSVAGMHLQPSDTLPSRPGYWLAPSQELHVFGRSALEFGKIGVVAGIIIDQDRLNALKELLGVDIVLQYEKKPLLSTLDLAGVVAFIDEGAVINGDTLLTEEILISEKIDVILFIK